MFELTQLPFEYAALEPFIDASTVEIHHTKHHQNYCNNLNKLLENHHEFNGMAIYSILKNIASVPDDIRQSVINNGGGYYNHNMYWECMGVKNSLPEGLLLEKINQVFVTFADFQKLFSESATKLFGSGWTWLVKTKNEDLKILNTLIQDCPLTLGLEPLLALDVWEHAYYLKYQNRRTEYIQSWWNIIDWKKVGARLETPPL